MFMAAALLGVGIAAVLITSGLVHTLLLRQVSATHGDTLRRIVATDRVGRTVARFSFGELQVLREAIADAGEVATVYLQPVVLRAGSTDVQTMAEIVDGPYFALTGTRTVIGRSLLTIDDHHSAPPVAVLAAPFWRRHFNGSPAALGSTIRLNGSSFTIVGVADVLGSSSFLGASVDAWVSLSHADPLLNPGWRTNIADRWFTAFVLPKDSKGGVENRLATAAQALAARHADSWRDRRLQTADAMVMIGPQRTAAKTLGVVLAGLALLILIAAGANVGGVLIARSAAHQRAAAIHMSIGAGRTTVVRRQMLEGAILGFVAGTIAVAVYAWIRTAVAEMALLPTLALRLDLPMTESLVAAALGGGAIIGMLIALGPALWSTRLDVAQALRDGNGRAGGSARATTFRAVLVSAQIALSLMLIVGAALFVRSFEALTDVDVGFPRERLVAMDFDVEPAVRMPSELPALAREALTRVARLPDVVAAAMSNRAPIDQSTPSLAVEIAGDATRGADDVTIYLATAGYFETLGLGIVHGRAFTAAEADGAEDVVVINESLARRLWPGTDALDRSLHLPAESKTLRVIGIARDSKYRVLTESGQPHIYRPAAPGLGLTLLVRTRTDPRGALRAIQRELDTVGPGLVGFFPRTLEDHLAVQLLPTRVAANAATVLGVLALCLSAAALYALTAWFVVLRRREIGVRMALGASTADVRRLVVGQALRSAMPGIALGTAGAVALGVAARSALHDVSPVDPFAFGLGIALLLVMVLIAGYVPSRAATRVDPAVALRQ
jgi:predicted permease